MHTGRVVVQGVRTLKSTRRLSFAASSSVVHSLNAGVCELRASRGVLRLSGADLVPFLQVSSTCCAICVSYPPMTNYKIFLLMREVLGLP